jgi:hypothetical protein
MLSLSTDYIGHSEPAPTMQDASYMWTENTFSLHKTHLKFLQKNPLKWYEMMDYQQKSGKSPKII